MVKVTAASSGLTLSDLLARSSGIVCFRVENGSTPCFVNADAVVDDASYGQMLTFNTVVGMIKYSLNTPVVELNAEIIVKDVRDKA